MSDIYVEVTKEHLQGVRQGFETRVVQFLHDFKQRRISYVMAEKKKGLLGIGRGKWTRKDAELYVSASPEEQSLAEQIMAGLDVLRQFLSTAAAAPAGTKFMVTLEQYQWFLPQGLVS